MKRPLLSLLFVCIIGKLTINAQSADSLRLRGLAHEGTGSNLLGKGIVMALNLSTQHTSISAVSNGVIDIDSLLQGGYYIYAVPDPFVNTSYLPTYFVNKIDPSQAAYVPLTGSVSDLDIYLVAKTVSEAGTAALNGRFYYYDVGNDAGTDFSKKWFNTPTPPTVISISGNSCNTLPVLLYNSQNQIVAWTITDTQGYFQFRNLAGGTYYAKGQRNGYMNWNDGFINIAASTTAESTFRLYKNIATEIENDPLEEQNVAIYPNPFKEQFRIEARGRIVVTDVSGNVWYDQDHPHEQPIDGSAWPLGLYFVKTGNRIQKLIKQ